MISEISTQLPASKLKDNSHQQVEYVVEFNNTVFKNFSQQALGDRDPYKLEWTLEIEPFSSFSFNIMRNNVFQLCMNVNHKRLRETIIEG